jgi:hypothetical protein
MVLVDLAVEMASSQVFGFRRGGDEQSRDPCHRSRRARGGLVRVISAATVARTGRPTTTAITKGHGTAIVAGSPAPVG